MKKITILLLSIALIFASCKKRTIRDTYPQAPTGYGQIYDTIKVTIGEYKSIEYIYNCYEEMGNYTDTRFQDVVVKFYSKDFYTDWSREDTFSKCKK